MSESNVYVPTRYLYSPANMAPAQITNWLKISEPTIVPIPRALWVIKIETKFENSSGAEAPAAIKVAPATSSDIDNLVAIMFRAGTNL